MKAGISGHVEKGKFGNVVLDGVSLAWLGHSAGPLHKGDVTSLAVLDGNANAAQRKALATLLEGKSGGAWMIFSRGYRQAA